MNSSRRLPVNDKSLSWHDEPCFTLKLKFKRELQRPWRASRIELVINTLEVRCPDFPEQGAIADAVIRIGRIRMVENVECLNPENKFQSLRERDFFLGRRG